MEQSIIDYIKWRGDLTLKQVSFNEIDALILSELSYVNFKDIVPENFCTKEITLKDAVKNYFEAPDIMERTKSILFIDTTLIEMIQLLEDSNRFNKMKLCGYTDSLDSTNEKQFAAMTINLGDGSFFISYRGTDDSLIGWKEDFNMAFLTPVPSQLEALKYLTKASSSLRGKIRLGGHSKGGNVAVYAATFCSAKIKRRIIDIYNNDGPGFESNIISSKEFKSISNKLHTFVPQTSIVGLLLDHKEEHTIILSNEKGLMQHNPFSWQLNGPKFLEVESLSKESILIDKTIHEWLKEMTLEQRENFVDALFEILTSSKATTLTELAENWTRNPIHALKAVLSLDETTRHIVWKALQRLVISAKDNLPPLSSLLDKK